MKIVAIGDSVAEGLGARGRPYPVLVAEHFDAELLNLARTGSQLVDVEQYVPLVSDADVVVLQVGGASGMFRPVERAIRLFPARWRLPGALDPRPYFSTNKWKRLVQRVESGLRWRTKVLLMKFVETERWTPPEEYREQLDRYLTKVGETGSPKVIIVGIAGIDDRFFPGSEASRVEYDDIGRDVGFKHGATFVSLNNRLSEWDDFLADHAHPNVQGHSKISQLVISAIESESVSASKNANPATSEVQ